MPSGLDGNRRPIASEQRSLVIAAVGERVLQVRVARASTTMATTIVAIDGIDGSGKSTFADELALWLEQNDVRTVRATVDSFHHPRAIRWRRGRASPAGFYYDSHDLEQLTSKLLQPFASGPGNHIVTEVFDERADAALDAPTAEVQHGSVLVLDGIFLQRPELVEYHDLAIFLDGAERVSLRRLGVIANDLPADGSEALAHVLDWVTKMDRYVAGMALYLDLVNPIGLADIVIDNNDFANPVLTQTP